MSRGYFIGATSRSGSTYLCGLLTSTGRLGAPLEYLNPGPNNGAPLCAQWGVDFGSPEHLDMIRATATEGLFGVKGAVGAYERFVEWLGAPALLIWMRRADKLRQAISLYLARWRQQHNRGTHWRPGKPKPDDADAPFVAGKIRRCLDDVRRVERRWAQLVDERRGPTAVVWYEQLLEAPAREVHRIARLLDVDPTALGPVEPRTIMQRDERTERWVAALRGGRVG